MSLKRPVKLFTLLLKEKSHTVITSDNCTKVPPSNDRIYSFRCEMLLLKVVHQDGLCIEWDTMLLPSSVHLCVRVDDFTDEKIDMLSQALNIGAGAGIAGIDERTLWHVEAIRQRLVKERILAARFEAVMGIGCGGDPGGPDREQ